jgi:CRP/FNR family transcriptional regulator
MSRWIEAFPGLLSLETGIGDRLVAESRIVELPGGSVIFGPGKAPDSMLFLLDGVVRVQQVADSGREIVLYRVEAGQTCVLTTACLLAYEDYCAEGRAETTVRAAALPRTVFDDLVAGSAAFRRFVFTAYSRRITELLTVIQEVAFARVDLRLAQKLCQFADGDGLVRLTHQQLATELGTAREVVSRQLHEFQRRGWVAAARGTVRLTDRRALADFAGSR